MHHQQWTSEAQVHRAFKLWICRTQLPRRDCLNLRTWLGVNLTECPQNNKQQRWHHNSDKMKPEIESGSNILHSMVITHLFVSYILRHRNRLNCTVCCCYMYTQHVEELGSHFKYISPKHKQHHKEQNISRVLFAAPHRRYQPEWKLKNAVNHKVNWSHYVCIKSCWINLIFIILEYNFNCWNSYDCIIDVYKYVQVHERHINAASSWVKKQ